jgi:hypothetical protein
MTTTAATAARRRRFTSDRVGKCLPALRASVPVLSWIVVFVGGFVALVASFTTVAVVWGALVGAV